MKCQVTVIELFKKLFKESPILMFKPFRNKLSNLVTVNSDGVETIEGHSRFTWYFDDHAIKNGKVVLLIFLKITKLIVIQK